MATIAIVLAPPLYIVKEQYIDNPANRIARKPYATFVGVKKCIECHKQEYEKWKGSHHDLAMDVANEESVLGDFSNAVFEHKGITSVFYRKGKKFFVHTQGPDGKMGDFKATHTLGAYPLQQYLIPFPGGRLQCLPIAWDVKKKKWYHLYPDEPQDPKDWLHWTNAGQTWNGMCAECHSTNLKKNYDYQTDTYSTTWSEIDVSCEACHGPGSGHVEWAELPAMARPETNNVYELELQTAGMSSRQEVELCAPCHSRRILLGDYTHNGKYLMDSLIPTLLSQALYFPDGQILEEVYVYGSFVQSKMFDRDVRCSECHDVHSVKLVKEGNDLCLQCHRDDIYDIKNHHFHKKKGEKGEPVKSSDGKILFEVGTGAECVQCHMPGRYYMGIDYRPDHSFRVPRPDLSMQLGIPNACNRCHIDQTDKWSMEHMTKWYGIKHKPHWGIIIDAGQKRLPGAEKELIRLADERLFPTIVRATALSLLSSYSGEEIFQVLKRSLEDEEALMRQTAIRHLVVPDPQKQIDLISPLLYDPVKAVRIEAAQMLTEVPSGRMNQRLNGIFQAALNESKQAMEYSADFASSRLNLGNIYSNLGQLEKAEEHFRSAIQIDPDFYPAKVNLAMLDNQKGKNDEAEALLREVAETHPEFHEVNYSLGLLLAEKKEFEEAARFLEKAAKGLPDRARVHYNLGLLLEYLQRDAEAEAALSKALELEPAHMDYLAAVVQSYMKKEKFQEAKRIAEQIIAKYPTSSIGHDILESINRRVQQ